MKIYVDKPDLKNPIQLNLPNSIAFSRAASLLTHKATKDELPELTDAKIYYFLSTVRECIREMGHFTLVHVEKEDGTIIDITL